MKTTTLRILFTLAILAGMAAAPNAQTFRWQAGRQNDDVRIQTRVQIAIDRAQRAWERTFDRINRGALRADGRRARIIGRQLRARSVRGLVHKYNYVENAGAQIGSDADPCRNDNWGNSDYERHCEVRESTMPAGPLNVDAGQNGGIVIEGWDRNEIRVRAVAHGNARSEARAKELAGQVQVQAGGGRVNGETRNGGVTLAIPDNYNAELETRTVNGGLNIEFPITIQGELTSRRGISTTLGSGGPLVRVRTTNGGVRIGRR